MFLWIFNGKVTWNTGISSKGRKRKENPQNSGSSWVPLSIWHFKFSRFHRKSGDCVWIQGTTQERNTMFFVRRQDLRRCVLALPIPTRGKSQRSSRKLAEKLTILTYNKLLLPVNYRYWIRPSVAFYNFGPSVSSISIQYLCAKIVQNRSIRRKISSWVHILTRY